jgi:hypothetical protein
MDTTTLLIIIIVVLILFLAVDMPPRRYCLPILRKAAFNKGRSRGERAYCSALRRAWGGNWQPGSRASDPEPTVQSLDPSFNKYRLALAGVERLAPGSALRRTR